MKDRYIPVARPFLDDRDKKGVMEVLESGQLSLGSKYIEFEKKISQYVGCKYACAVSNGTCGLHLAVRAVGLKEGDEVITSPFSFISSSNCLIYEKVKPVFVDIENATCNIDHERIEKAITAKTRAILVVHIFGQPANMSEILKIAKKHKLRIIEDACESLGSRYKNKMSGTFGDIGVYAFYPNKQMTTGEGGMIVTNSKNIVRLCSSMRNQGRDEEGNWLLHERLGYNYRMDEMSASLGITQLRKIDWMINQKRRIAAIYEKELSGIGSIITPKIGLNRTHSWFVYVIRIVNGKRDEVMKKLLKKNIQTKPYLPVIHLQPFMKKLFGFNNGDFPCAEKISSQTLALPLFIGLRKDDIRYICSEIKKIL
ncbi:MAG: DegT/DnrJ/EryC1/StrS family aminotransferase [Bacteroidota bacterium]